MAGSHQKTGFQRRNLGFSKGIITDNTGVLYCFYAGVVRFLRGLQETKPGRLDTLTEMNVPNGAAPLMSQKGFVFLGHPVKSKPA